MKIQTVHIVSNKICYGREPAPTTEVEQHLTIESNGKVYFTGYNYGEGILRHELGRTAKFTKRKDTINKIFDLFAEYIISDPLGLEVTDVGGWQMEITDENGTPYCFGGSLIGNVCVGNINLTEYLRKYIPVEGLMVFGNPRG